MQEVGVSLSSVVSSMDPTGAGHVLGSGVALPIHVPGPRQDEGDVWLSTGMNSLPSTLDFTTASAISNPLRAIE